MPESISYVQKVIGIKAVTLAGKLDTRKPDGHDRDPDFMEEWHIGKDRIDEWLEKFEGKHIRVVITTYEQDESHLLPENER